MAVVIKIKRNELRRRYLAVWFVFTHPRLCSKFKLVGKSIRSQDGTTVVVISSALHTMSVLLATSVE